MTVRQAPLGEVLHRVTRAVTVDPSSTYPNVGVLNRTRGVFKKPELRGAETKYKALFRLAAGDLVFSKLFGWEGAVALVPDWADGSYVSGEFPAYSLSSQINKNYLGHVIAWEGFASQMAALTTGMGQRRQRVNPDQFERIMIPLPPFNEQQRIAARLDRVAHVHAFPSPTAQLDRSIHSLLREGRSRPLAAALDLEINDFSADPYAVYERAGVLGFGRGLFAHGPMRGSETKYAKLRHIHTGQLVMSRLKAFEGAVAVATPAFDGAVVSQEFATFTPKAATDLDWVDALCRWPAFWDALRATSTGIGARRERVSADALLSLEVPYPGDAPRRRISALQRSRLRVASLEEERERLRTVILPAARNETFGHLT